MPDPYLPPYSEHFLIQILSVLYSTVQLKAWCHLLYCTSLWMAEKLKISAARPGWALSAMLIQQSWSHHWTNSYAKGRILMLFRRAIRIIRVRSDSPTFGCSASISLYLSWAQYCYLVSSSIPGDYLAISSLMSPP